ncbi:MAG: hypothetical protein ACRC1M_08630 [Methanobacteriaceae archaeon]
MTEKEEDNRILVAFQVNAKNEVINKETNSLNDYEHLSSDYIVKEVEDEGELAFFNNNELLYIDNEFVINTEKEESNQAKQLILDKISLKESELNSLDYITIKISEYDLLGVELSTNKYNGYMTKLEYKETLRTEIRSLKSELESLEGE